MKKSERLVFFGTEDFSAASLESLINNGWNLAAIVTKPDTPSGRGQKISPPKVKTIAESHKIPVLQPSSPGDIENELREFKSTAGVLVSYGKIIPESVINLFPRGILNLHPSLLPKYRGPSPIETVLLNGDQETGISLMAVTSGMDAGPVFFQSSYRLDGSEDRISLSAKLATAGAALLVSKLPAILSGELIAQPQDDSQATYTRLLSKQDGIVDWSQPAEDIERKVRAYLGFPRTKAKIFGREVIVTKTRVAKNQTDGQLIMKCSPGWLEVTELIAPSGRIVSGADFIRGYKV